MPRFTDHVKISEIDSMDNYDGQELTLLSITPCESKFGAAVRLSCQDSAGNALTFVTTGCVLYPKMLEYAGMVARGEAELPVSLKFVKSGRTWVIE